MVGKSTKNIAEVEGGVQKKPILSSSVILRRMAFFQEKVIIINPHLIPRLSDLGEPLGKLAPHMAIDWPPTASEPRRDLSWGA